MQTRIIQTAHLPPIPPAPPHFAGLDVDKDQILEMACIVTDGDMNIIAEVIPPTLLLCRHASELSLLQGPDMIVHQPDSVLEGMGEWCKEHHGKVSVWCSLCKLAASLLPIPKV